VKVRTVTLWNANLSTNIRSVLYYAVFVTSPPSNTYFGIFSQLADTFAEIEKHKFKVDEASIIKQKNSVEITAVNLKNLGYRTVIVFTTCKKCGRHLFPNKESVALHDPVCPYRIVLEVIES
jgi:predicted Zn-ribbon and HTH transcriptional regulator